jgi:pimeloyl-ACP methyl ester carboxylesterase
MFEPLFARLSDHYHLIAPDYPGFGHSDWPDPKRFDYSFDRIASVIDNLTEAIGLSHYTLYMQDYGGPVGLRMILAHPDRVRALIVQNAVAHNEGLGPIWATRRAFWADRPANEEALRENLLSFATTKSRHVGDDPKIELYDPDTWIDEYAFLNAPGQARIQTDLFYDYRTNVAAYPKPISNEGSCLPQRTKSFGCVFCSHACHLNRNVSVKTCRMQASTYSTQGTSRLTLKQTRLRRCYVSS